MEHRSTSRVLDIFDALADLPDGLTLTELSQVLHAPKSSLLPILKTLQQRRYLRLDFDTGRYRLGINAFAIGAAAANGGGLGPIIQVMKEVTANCHETCQLGILENQDVLYVAKEDSPQPIRMISWVGKRLPANATAIGKALLSGLDDAEIAARYQDGFLALTEKTITELPVLLEQLHQIRAGKLAFEQEEATDQVMCWAVPLFYQDQVFAALSVSLPLFRYSLEKEAQIETCLKDAKAQIEQLGILRAFHVVSDLRRKQ